MANVNPENKVRFAWWGAEERGKVGSDYYVSNLSDEERKSIAMYLDFDAIGVSSVMHQLHIYSTYMLIHLCNLTKNILTSFTLDLSLPTMFALSLMVVMIRHQKDPMLLRSSFKITIQARGWHMRKER